MTLLEDYTTENKVKSMMGRMAGLGFDEHIEIFSTGGTLLLGICDDTLIGQNASAGIPPNAT